MHNHVKFCLYRFQVYGFEDISKWKLQYEKVLEEEISSGDAEMTDVSQDVGK